MTVAHENSATQTDYYDEVVDEDDESEDEDADNIPLIEPAPRCSRFAEESICACCRFSLLKKSELAILDGYAKHVATEHWSVPYMGEIRVRKIKHKFQKLWATRGHWETFFYRQVTQSRYMSYLLLSIIRGEKNIIDNERFTKEALKIRHKGPSEAEKVAAKRARRSEEHRSGAPNESTKNGASTSEKGQITPKTPSGVLTALASTSVKEISLDDYKSTDPAVGVAYDIVDGKPSLHRMAKLKLDPGAESEQEPATSKAKTLSNFQAPEAPVLLLFHPESDNPDSPEYWEDEVHVAGLLSTESLRHELIESEIEEAIHAKDRRTEREALIPPYSEMEEPRGRSQNSKHNSEIRYNYPELPRPPKPASGKESTQKSSTIQARPNLSQPVTPEAGRPVSCSSTATLVEASTRRPKATLPANSEGPSTTSIWIIIGWLPAEVSEPIETCVIVEHPGHFLPDLKKHITVLRGWRSKL